jgi:hypothetical protein
MFLRFLGRVFLYFFVIPSMAGATKKIVIPTIRKELTLHLIEKENEVKRQRARSRQDHPAGARRR